MQHIERCVKLTLNLCQLHRWVHMYSLHWVACVSFPSQSRQ